MGSSQTDLADRADRARADRARDRIDELALRKIGEQLLVALGYDVEAPELRDTPSRWARWWIEFHRPQDARLDSTFEVKTAGHLVVVSGISVWSVCEHHLLPFSAQLAIGYLPNGRVLGLSKFARIAMEIARRLQVQERLVEEVAADVTAATGSPDVCVVARGRHLCMEARGIRSLARTDTVVARGAFEADRGLRADLFALAGLGAAGRDGREHLAW